MSDQSRTEKLRQHRTAYWARFRKDGRRRVYGTLSGDEYDEIAAIAKANGRSVFGQIWAEALAYRRQRYVPSKDIEHRVASLFAALRSIGNNLNQIAREKNTLGRLTRPGRVMAVLAALEQAVADFLARPWRLDVEGGDDDH